MLKQNNKFFPYKHYLYFIIGIVVALLIGWYIYSWITIKKEEKLSSSYLLKTNTITYSIDTLKEISSISQEAPTEYFIYISYTGSDAVYKLEKKLKKIIDDYNLKDEFYLLDITSIKNNEDTLDKLNDKFNTTKIINTPCILYYKDSALKEILIDKNGIFDYNNFINLLKDNAYEKASWWLFKWR